MRVGRGIRFLANNKIAAAIGIAMLFLITEAGFHVFVLGEHKSILAEMLTADLHENVSRLSVVILLVSFALYVQIAEKKRAAVDRELVNAGIEWKRTFDAIPDFIAIIDADFRIQRVNTAMAKRLGVEPELARGSLCYKSVHGTDEPPAYCPHISLLRDSVPHTTEIYEERLGGDYLVTVTPLFDQQGRLMGCTHVARDISERKRDEEQIASLNHSLEMRVLERTAELAAANDSLHREMAERMKAEATLRMSEKKFRTLYEESMDGLFVTSSGGEFIEVNKKCVSLFGYDGKEDLMRVNLARDVYADPDDRKRILALVNERGSLDCSVAVKKKNGEPMMTQVYLAAVKDETGLVTSYRGIVRDVTEQSRAEAARLRMTRELRAISSCHQALLRVDDEQELLNEICRIVCDEAGYRFAWVGYAEYDAAKSVRPVAWAGTEDGYLATAKISWADTERGRGPAGVAIRSGKTAYIQDFTKSPEFAPWMESAIKRGYRSAIGLPLKDENANVFGVLLLYSAEPGAFTPDEIRLQEDLSHDLAFGIVTLRMRRERRRAMDALRESEERYRRIASATTDYIYTVSVENGAAQETRHGAGCKAVTGFNAGEFDADPYLWISMVAPDDRKTVEERTRRVLAGEDVAPIEHRLVRKDGEQRWVLSTIVPRRDTAGRLLSYDGLIQDITERKQADEMLRNYTHQLRILSARLMEARESERRQIAHELHDEIGQALTGIKLSIDAVQRKADKTAATVLSSVQDELNSLMVRVRDLSLNLRPSLLDTLGLVPTLQWHFKRYTAQTGVAVNFIHDQTANRLAPEIEIALFRVVQEALTNVARHAHVNSVDVSLRITGRNACAEIDDRGSGFDVDASLERGATMGVAGMRERVSGLGGELALHSAKGAGTTLIATIPLSGDPPALYKNVSFAEGGGAISEVARS
jgi:PAS domain S-box-containing protein